MNSRATWSHQLVWVRQRLATLVQLSRHNPWRGSDENGTLSVTHWKDVRIRREDAVP
jgi:hypothetical protein